MEELALLPQHFNRCHCEEQEAERQRREGDVAIWSSSMNKQGFVYILANRSNRVLYTGVSSDLVKRVHQHKHGTGSAFTAKYKVKKLVYYEVLDDMYNAISREKQIKNMSRKKKDELISGFNPSWRDLSDEI
ncbi:MAG TPA: GIY-YIG nuclease family protein [candidate division Zixibacteria bacterium]|nr:GIY-YIG nuclease family protein [candidate division Zixibacteria bacterium]